MLQGITHISTNTDYSEVKKDYKLNGKHRAYMEDDSDNDQIEVSPAFKYISKLNWQIQKIDVNDKNKITLGFNVNDFVITVTLDIKMLPHVKKIYLSIRKKLTYKHIEMVISVPFIINRYETFDNFSLDNLDILFTRIEYLIRTNELNPPESKVSYGMYEDLIPNLKSEFQKILYGIMIFAEKLTSQNILGRIENNADNYENLKVEHVEVR